MFVEEILLYLANNNFTGSIPTEITNLTNLTDLDLHGNQFFGFISNKFCEFDLTGDITIKLSFNQLCPAYPSCFTNDQIGDQTIDLCPECSNEEVGLDSLCYSQNDLDVLVQIADNSNKSTDYVDVKNMGDQDWNEDGKYVMGEVLVQTQVPFENFANLSTWLFFSTIIGWYCVSRIGWKRTTGVHSYRMGLLQLMLLGFTIICFYEVLWNFTILNAEITSHLVLSGTTPDIDALAVEYPDVLRPWNLIFATKVWLAGTIISGHAFYLSTKPRKTLEEMES